MDQPGTSPVTSAEENMHCQLHFETSMRRPLFERQYRVREGSRACGTFWCSVRDPASSGCAAVLGPADRQVEAVLHEIRPAPEPSTACASSAREQPRAANARAVARPTPAEAPAATGRSGNSAVLRRFVTAIERLVPWIASVRAVGVFVVPAHEQHRQATEDQECNQRAPEPEICVHNRALSIQRALSRSF